MDTRQNTTRNVFPRTTNSFVPGYNDYTSDFNDFHQANSTAIKAKKRKWNIGQSIYDCYSEVPTKKVVSNEIYYQQRPETKLSLFELDLSTLCPGYPTNETIHSKVGSNKPPLNGQRPERVLSLLGPLFTSGSESPETFRKIIPSNGLPYSNECSIEEALALPELGMSPKIHHKTDLNLNLFSSDSTFSKQHTKTTLGYLNQVFPLPSNKLNKEKCVEIDDSMDTNYIEDEEIFY